MDNENLTSVNTTDNTVNTPAPVETPVAQTVEPAAQPAPVETTIEQAPVTPVVEAAPTEAPTPVENIAPTTPEVPTQAPVETVTPGVTPVNTTTEGVPTPPTSDLTAATITPPALETPEDPNAKKKSKTPIIIIAIIVVILVILAAVFYFTQYNSKDSRIDNITNSIFGELTSIINKEKQEIKTKESGSYTFSVSGTVNGDALGGAEYTANAKIDGNYGIDLDNKDIYATVKLEDLVLLKESLIGSDALKADVEINEDTLYVVLNDIFDKTITSQNDSIKEIFENIESTIKNDNSTINIEVLVNAIRDASSSALKAMDSKQSVSSGSIGLHNSITYQITNANLKKAYDAFYASLRNNTEFVKEMATIGNITEEEFKENLTTEYSETDELDEHGFTLEIATSLTGTNLLGVFVDGKDTTKTSCNYNGSISYELVPTDNGYKFTQVNPNSGNYTVELTKTTEGTTSTITAKVTGKIQSYDKTSNSDNTVSCTKDELTKIDVTVTTKVVDDTNNKSITLSVDGTYAVEANDGQSSSIGAKVEISAERTIDAAYTDSTIDKKNTIAYTDLTEEDIATIENNLSQKFDKLMPYLSLVLGSSSNSSSYDDYDYSYSTDDDDDYSYYYDDDDDLSDWDY